MRIDKRNSCVKSILTIFHDFNDLYQKPAIAVQFGKSYVSSAEETNPRVTSISSANMKIRNVETTHKFPFKTLYFVHRNFRCRPFLESIQVVDEKIQPKPSARNLGVIIDQSLDLTDHMLTKSAFPVNII